MGKSDVRSPEVIWRAHDAMEVRLTAHVSERMIALAGLRPGMRVLDLATGRGEPAVRAAHVVGAGGTVVGIDTSAPMLSMAAERAAREGVSLDLRAMRCEELRASEPPFDAVLARWGLMYLSAPMAALIATKAHMAPGAPIVAAVWADADRVSYHALPRRVLARYTEVPAEPADGPGVYRYGAVGSLERDMERAGLEVRHVEEIDTPVVEADTIEALVQWCRDFGMAKLLAPLPEETQRAWERDLAEAAAPLRVDGRFRLGGVTRVIVARA